MKDTSAFKSGSLEEFDKNWRKRPEALYNHWSPSLPDNQIRLAFRSHFELFTSLESYTSTNKRFIELGAGRGSLSAYYSQFGYDVSLLDTSEEILSNAKAIFNHYPGPVKYMKRPILP